MLKTGNRRVFPLNLADVGVDDNVQFIFVEGIGFVADRNVCTGKSYNRLEECGYVTGKEITIDGERFLCRLLTCTEWDDCMDYDDSNEVWHWKDVYSWVRSLEYERAKDDWRVLRGYTASSILNTTSASYTDVHFGFRPALEVLASAPLTSDKGVTVEQTADGITINVNVTLPQTEPIAMTIVPAEPTEQQLEIAELAKPLARYLSDNIICGEVIVSMNTVALRWEGFTAKYYDDFQRIDKPR